MKKLFISIMLVVGAFSSTSYANEDCYQKISNDYSSDSRSFQVYDSDLNGDFSENPIEYSKEALLHVVTEQVGCEEKELIFNEKAITLEACKEIVPGNPMSRVCYLESNLGYFFVTMDMLDSVNIIFNRWD